MNIYPQSRHKKKEMEYSSIVVHGGYNVFGKLLMFIML